MVDFCHLFHEAHRRRLAVWQGSQSPKLSCIYDRIIKFMIKSVLLHVILNNFIHMTYYINSMQCLLLHNLNNKHERHLHLR